jgi:hypothetical protein
MRESCKKQGATDKNAELLQRKTSKSKQAKNIQKKLINLANPRESKVARCITSYKRHKA